jgi:hypothetical protein
MGHRTQSDGTEVTEQDKVFVPVDSVSELCALGDGKLAEKPVMHPG